MTRAQVRAAMGPLVAQLQGGAWNIVGFDGLDNDVGQLMVATPYGYVLAVELPINMPVLNPLASFVARAQANVSMAMRPYSGESGRGFNGPRGRLPQGSRGYSALEGWV